MVTLREGRAHLNLRPGAHAFTITRPDFETEVRSLIVSATNTSLQVALKESYGELMIASDPEVDVTALGPDGRERPLGLTDSMGRLGPFSLPAGPYEITLRRARCVTEVRHVRVTGKRRVEVAVKPGWLPGSLLVRHPAPAEVWRRGARLGETGAVITNLPAGETAIQVRRPASAATRQPPSYRRPDRPNWIRLN